MAPTGPLRALSDFRDAVRRQAIAAAKGDVVQASEFVTAVRLRLGVPILDEPTECACCGGVLDRDVATRCVARR